jgi:hypothetical protein
MPTLFNKILGNKNKTYSFSFNIYDQLYIYIYRQIGYRQRRSLDDNWHLADILYHRLYEHDAPEIEDDIRDRRSETPLELRPVGGPINIEQLPAMLAARYVKRYPYSQHIDPAIM